MFQIPNYYQMKKQRNQRGTVEVMNAWGQVGVMNAAHKHVTGFNVGNAWKRLPAIFLDKLVIQLNIYQTDFLGLSKPLSLFF